MNDAFARFIAARHFPGLDGIRCIAILAVIWHHSLPPQALPMLGRGFLGVDLFFILSGFLISTLLIREKSATGKISLADFWVRRALRLVPAYYALLFALAGAYLVLKPGSDETRALITGFPVYALYLSNWINPGAPNLSPTWSLATEEQFYLVWPLFEAFAAPVASAGAIVIGLVINQLINFGVLDGAVQHVTGWTPQEHPEILQTTFTPILLGVGLAHLLNRKASFDFLRRIAGFRRAGLVFAILCAALLNWPVADISGLPRLSLHFAFALFIASVILRPESAATRFLEWRPVSFVGKISYGIYLYHMFALHAASAITRKLGLAGTPATFLLGAALSIAVAAASFYLLEKRFLDLRKKFRPAAKAQPQA